jgi:hypothetical protein
VLPAGDAADTDTIESLTEECTPERPRQCDLTVAIAYARDMASDEGIAAPRLQAIIDRQGYRDEAEVRAALVELVDNAPQGEIRDEAGTILAFAFGPETAPDPGGDMAQ